MMKKRRDKVFHQMGWEFGIPSQIIDENRERYKKAIKNIKILCYYDGLTQLIDCYSIWTLMTFSFVELNEICKSIWVNSEFTGTIVQGKNFSDRFPKLPNFEASLKQLLLDAEKWALSYPFDEVIERALAERPDTDIAKQVLHITALVYKADFMTLMDYQDSFAKGYKMNFGHNIEKEHIDRAVDLALERSSEI